MQWAYIQFLGGKNKERCWLDFIPFWFGISFQDQMLLAEFDFLWSWNQGPM
jgi:hypothetical protein